MTKNSTLYWEYPNDKKLHWFQHEIMIWAKANLRDFPWRKTKDSYNILIAEFLLQQTDAPRIIPVYGKLIDKYPTLKHLATTSVEEISAILDPLGFHYRANKLSEIARTITEDTTFGCKIPDSEEKLMRFNGIGRYIAKAICSQAFNQPVAVLDTNVSRIIQRFFGLQPHNKRSRDDPYFWKVAQKIAPSNDVGAWNLALVDFGALICTYRDPRCKECPILQQCTYMQKKEMQNNSFIFTSQRADFKEKARPR
jgi:A/G-specific DNA glycosylase